MAVGDIYQLDVLTHLEDVNAANIFHYEQIDTEAVGKSPERDLIDEFIAHVLPLWKVPLSDDYKFDCIRATKIFPLPRGVTVASFALGEGNQNGQAVPPAAVFKFRFYTPTLNDTGRANKHFSGLFAESQTAGSIEPGPMGPIDTFAASLEDNLPPIPLGGRYAPGVFSQKLSAFSQGVVVNTLPRLTTMGSRKGQICQI